MAQHYYYAVASVLGETPVVYRFEYPSDRALWIGQGGPGARRLVLWNDPRVMAAKAAAERGEYEWPTPEWKRV